MRKTFFAAPLMLLAMGALAASPGNPLGSYRFYPTAVEGSARVVGLAGSTLTDPRDYSAVFVNPAGLGGMTGDGVDIGSDSNNIDNFFIDPTDPKQRQLSDPLRFSFFGFRYVTTDGWGFGFASQTPYKLDDVFQGTAKVSSKSKGKQTGQDQSELQAESDIYTIGAAKEFFDHRLAVGMAANYIQVRESYDFAPVFATTAPIHIQATNDAFSADLGVIAKPRPWLRLAAVYKMSYRVPFDPSRNADAINTSGNVSAFRDGKAPDRVALGLGWFPNQYFRMFAQTNIIFKTSDALIVGSGLFPGTSSSVGVGRSNTVDGHWGAELVPIDEPDLTIKFWAGGYLEDTGIEGGFRRYHRTAGFGFNPWFLNVSMAIDDAALYNNFTVGLGIDLLEVSERVAKKYGWKLPL